MKAIKYLTLLLGVILIISWSPKWGFFAHKRINKLAVFTLPQDFNLFFKKNIDFLEEHAVDPDSRRYAVKGEGYRHYIDLDEWGTYPFDTLPRTWLAAQKKFSTITFYKDGNPIEKKISDTLHTVLIKEAIFRYDGSEVIILDSISKYGLEDVDKIEIQDHLSKHGILPYNIQTYYNRLVKAFKYKNMKSVLKLSADLGHYIADAHVPLHTSSNYNGQLTNQHGIHAFWESRLPELFADETYDYWVGQAVYIEDIESTTWNIILESNALVNTVLSEEMSLRNEFPEDQQMCIVDRNNISVHTQCENFASAYHTSMNGMVEKRMKDAIFMVGSYWYSAWIDAGKPSMIFDESETKEVAIQLDSIKKVYQSIFIQGRTHEH